jgi:hypothetical protein
MTEQASSLRPSFVRALFNTDRTAEKSAIYSIIETRFFEGKRINSDVGLNCTTQQSCLVELRRWRIESVTLQFDDLILVGRSAWCPVRLGRPSNREECSLHLETLDNTGNEARSVLGSALLEAAFILRCLSARAITEAA